jgi:hypothetical protein
MGGSALFNNTIGSTNTAVGSIALSNNSSGNNNIALGFAAGGAVSTANYSNIQPQVGTDPDAVTINSNGRLGPGQRFFASVQTRHPANADSE